MELKNKIENRTAKIGVIGLGYVGLPLVIEFAKAGFKIVGFDVDPKKVASLRKGASYIKHIPAERIAECGDAFTPTTDFNQLGEVDCIIICVPTPLSRNREPDMTYVMETCHTIAAHLRAGQLVSLESTTYPGTTDEDMRAVLEEGGLRAGKDFYLAYSPEREDPNNPEFSTGTIPKVVGGYSEDCLTVAKALYDTIVVKTVPVSSTKAAEATKLLENIYRSVNIALVNELKILFDRMDIDVYEVINAAKTKPFGFHAFYPGPGLGGHCIPIDPFYLTWKAREFDLSTRFIELAGEINAHMPYYVVEKTVAALNEQGHGVKGARILVLGLAYKKDVDDTRESVSLKIIDLLHKRGAKVDYNDPLVPHMPKMRRYAFEMDSVEMSPEMLAGYDCVLISTDHSSYDYQMIVDHARLVVDSRNATNGLEGKATVVKA